MEHVPEFRNLYYKSLIPMRIHDKENFIKTENVRRVTGNEVLKWLTAYVWHDEERNFGWRVVVYPASEDGTFIEFKPFFDSKTPTTFHKAKQIMTLVEVNIFNDTLTTNQLFR